LWITALLHRLRSRIALAGDIGADPPTSDGEAHAVNGVVADLSVTGCEFSPSAMDTLREPLEERSVTISRADGAATYPARFVLVAR